MIYSSSFFVHAQSKDEQKLSAAIEKFRLAMIDPDKAIFDQLMSPNLSYGHSGGLVENKADCIESMVSGKFNFETIELTEQTMQITGETAVVRHLFSSATHDAGKEPANIKLKVMMIWIKERGKWLLLARQSVRL